jgi:hypothetical protein
MFLFNKRNIAALIAALLISAGFLYAVLTPPSVFNFLPYEIHESIPMKVSESTFIIDFDICFSVALLFPIYILVRNGFKNFGLFRINKL